jgi:hypothetical protein
MEDVKTEIDESIYHKAQLEKNYFVNSFMQHYKELLNLYELKNNRQGYLKRIERAGKIVKDVDFHQNVLMIFKENISSEVFLRGMSKLETLSSFYHCNLMELHDIFWGNRRKDNVNLTDDEIMYTEQDIKQDVFCLFLDIDMYSMATDRVAVSTISSRNDKSRMGNKPKYTWVFFRGTYSDLKNTKGYSGILRLFAENNGKGYTVYDLNQKIGNQRISNITVPVSSSQTMPNEAPSGENLADIY